MAYFPKSDVKYLRFYCGCWFDIRGGLGIKLSDNHQGQGLIYDFNIERASAMIRETEQVGLPCLFCES